MNGKSKGKKVSKPHSNGKSNTSSHKINNKHSNKSNSKSVTKSKPENYKSLPKKEVDVPSLKNALGSNQKSKAGGSGGKNDIKSKRTASDAQLDSSDEDSDYTEEALELSVRDMITDRKKSSSSSSTSSSASSLSFLAGLNAADMPLKQNKKLIQANKLKPNRSVPSKAVASKPVTEDSSSDEEDYNYMEGDDEANGDSEDDDEDEDEDEDNMYSDSDDEDGDEDEDDIDDDDAYEDVDDDEDLQSGEEMSDDDEIDLSDVEDSFNQQNNDSDSDEDDDVDDEEEEEEEDIETKYEQSQASHASRFAQNALEDSSKLPLKSGNKLLIAKDSTPSQSAYVKQKQEQAKREAQEALEKAKAEKKRAQTVEANIPVLPDITQMTLPQLITWRKKQMTKAKDDLAEFASQITEDPENKIGEFKYIAKFYQESDDIRVQKLALLTAVRIFKDINPSYRIHEAGDTENGKEVSKETKKLRNFESLLLRQYQNFLLFLEKAVKDFQQSKQRPSSAEEELALEHKSKLAQYAVTCMCELLSHNPYFNFSVNLVTTLVPLLGMKKPEEIPAEICKTIRSIFVSDVKGDATLDVVKVTAKFIKAKNYNLPKSVVDPFLSLRLDSDLAAVKDINPVDNHKSVKAKHVSKKAKKQGKVQAELERALRETEAEVTKKERQKLQTETLKWVFLTYFRVLKNSVKSPLLPGVLEGLAKFAHLINIDFFSDLMVVLKGLLTNESVLVESKIHCVKAAFQILSGQGEALNIDLKDFYAGLYAILPLVIGREELIPSLVSCLELMLHQRKQSVDRAASFVKRLSTIALSLSPAGSLALLSVVRGLIKKNPKCEQLLDSDVSSSGAYRPDLDDPEHSNALASTLWELSLMSSHFHPYVVTYAAHLAQGAPVEGRGSLHALEARKSATTMFTEYDSSTGGFNPPIAPPKTHPFKKQMKKNGESQAVFLKERPLKEPSVIASVLKSQKVNSSSSNSSGIDLKSHFQLVREKSKQNKLKAQLRTIKSAIHAFDRHE